MRAAPDPALARDWPMSLPLPAIDLATMTLRSKRLPTYRLVDTETGRQWMLMEQEGGGWEWIRCLGSEEWRP